MIYSEFDLKNIPRIVDLVETMWAPPEAEKSFRRLYAEFVVQSNISEYEYSIQGLKEKAEVAEENPFAAAAFATKKHFDSEKKQLDKWFNEATCNGKNLTEEQKNSFKLSRTFLDLMDSRVYELMEKDDIKLALFVSLKKGCGNPLLERFKADLAGQGFKNMYLWTDCECNYEWYFKHGFELVEKAVYEPFSSPQEPYYTFVFRQNLVK
jgi:hypothetical protein